MASQFKHSNSSFLGSSDSMLYILCYIWISDRTCIIKMGLYRYITKQVLQCWFQETYYTENILLAGDSIDNVERSSFIDIVLFNKHPKYLFLGHS